jgi:hypothetical protein
MSHGRLSIATSSPRLRKNSSKPLVYIILCQKRIATGSIHLAKTNLRQEMIETAL